MNDNIEKKELIKNLNNKKEELIELRMEKKKQEEVLKEYCSAIVSELDENKRKEIEKKKFLPGIFIPIAKIVIYILFCVNITKLLELFFYNTNIFPVLLSEIIINGLNIVYIYLGIDILFDNFIKGDEKKLVETKDFLKDDNLEINVKDKIESFEKSLEKINEKLNSKLEEVKLLSDKIDKVEIEAIRKKEIKEYKKEILEIAKKVNFKNPGNEKSLSDIEKLNLINEKIKLEEDLEKLLKNKKHTKRKK